MKILGRSSLNYERSQKRLHSNQRIIWRAAKMESATRCPPDAQDRMESRQDGASCQMPRTRMEPAARCPGPGWSQLPDAQDQMESCQDGASSQMKPTARGPGELPTARCPPRTRWRAARMKPTARCPDKLPTETAQLPETQDPYPVVGPTDGHDTPPPRSKMPNPETTEEER